jgi:hypothetical protein
VLRSVRAAAAACAIAVNHAERECGIGGRERRYRMEPAVVELVQAIGELDPALDPNPWRRMSGRSRSLFGCRFTARCAHTNSATAARMARRLPGCRRGHVPNVRGHGRCGRHLGAGRMPAVRKPAVRGEPVRALRGSLGALPARAAETEPTRFLCGGPLPHGRGCRTEPRASASGERNPPGKSRRSRNPKKTLGPPVN